MKRTFSYIILFLAIWAVIYFEGRYMVYILEQTQLFQNDWNYILDNLKETGGLAAMLKEAVVQFCHIPLAGTLLLSMIALAAFAGTSSCIRTITGKDGHILIAAAAPLVPLIYSLIVCEDAYPLTAYAVVIAVTAGILNSSRKYSWIIAALVSPLLFHACGAAAILLPVLVAFSGRAVSIIPLAVYCIFGAVAVRADFIGEIKSFFMYRIPMYESNGAGAYSMPALVSWVMALLAASVPAVVLRKSTSRIHASAVGVLLPVFAALAVYMLPDKEYAHNLKYDRYNSWARLHYLYSSGKYDDILDTYEDKAPSTSVESNYINLALYRTGRLASDFFRYRPGWMHLSLRTEWIDMQFPFPYIWVEVCNEMGALARAHQSAFEGNILAGPRGAAPMVRYLAEAEIVRGNYKTAERYLSELDNTIFYKKWAREQRRFLSDDAVASNEYYAVKRACYYDEVRTFYDMNDLWLMKEVIKNSPKHRSTYDYAGIMVLSAGEMNTFVEFILEMTEAGLCKLPLPPVFQQAMVMAYPGNTKLLDIYRVDPALVNEYKEYSMAVNGKMNDKKKAQMVISRNRDKYWHYLYNLLKSRNSKK